MVWRSILEIWIELIKNPFHLDKFYQCFLKPTDSYKHKSTVKPKENNFIQENIWPQSPQMWRECKLVFRNLLVVVSNPPP